MNNAELTALRFMQTQRLTKQLQTAMEGTGGFYLVFLHVNQKPVVHKLGFIQYGGGWHIYQMTTHDDNDYVFLGLDGYALKAKVVIAGIDILIRIPLTALSTVEIEDKNV